MTEPDLIKFLAERAMEWPVFKESGHRPGSRPLPHAWQWRKDGRVHLMVFAGGDGPAANREWNPLTSPADRAELHAALLECCIDLRKHDEPGEFCAAAALAIRHLPPVPAVETHSFHQMMGKLVARQQLR